MRGLSLHQPWATFVALGEKGVETRGKKISYRGDVAICAAKVPIEIEDSALEALFTGILRRRGCDLSTLPLGAVVAVVDLAHCFPTEDLALELRRRIDKRTHPRHELTLGDYSRGRYGWILQRIRPLVEPYPLRGMQGLFPIAVKDQIEIRQRLGAARPG